MTIGKAAEESEAWQPRQPILSGLAGNPAVSQQLHPKGQSFAKQPARILSARRNTTMIRSALISVLAASTLLSACGRSAGPPTAGNEAASNAPATHSADAEMAGPFAADEHAMSAAMMKSVGADVSDTWVKTMIEHHRGAISMSKTVLTQSPPADVRKMAQSIIAKQTAEIDKLNKMLSSRPPEQSSMEPYHAAMTAMDNAMMAAQGANASETYLRKMLAHHKGAVAMSEIVLKSSSDPKIKNAAATIKADQTREIRDTEAMLGSAH